MGEQERRCGTCGWWRRFGGKVGAGECYWAKENWPWWIVNWHDATEAFTLATAGTDCPAWKPREEKRDEIHSK